MSRAGGWVEWGGASLHQKVMEAVTERNASFDFRDIICEIAGKKFRFRETPSSFWGVGYFFTLGGWLWLMSMW